MFFDGTLNNRTNTGDRKNWEQTGKLGKAPGEGSYKNDDSNVAKLFDGLQGNQPDYDISIKLYVEGIGTEDGKSDSLVLGAAFGRGGTGIKDKVGHGLATLIDTVTARVGPPDPTLIIDYVHIDAFGFSRGAAAARYFVHVSMCGGWTVAKDLKQQGYSVGDVKMRFVGLFDTVASFGVWHGSNTRDLDLDAITVAEKVVQIAAAEEYRENFQLTNIKSKKGGVEVFLPGAHSDIGGGYADDGSEVDWLLFYVPVTDSYASRHTSEAQNALDADHDWLVKRGWYLDSELRKVAYSRLIGNRRNISNHYARIPLHMMAKYAEELALVFNDVLDPIPPELAGTELLIQDAISSGATSTPDMWLDTDPVGLEVRHRYLHFSARYNGLGNGPQWDGDAASGGRRKRIIQDG